MLAATAAQQQQQQLSRTCMSPPTAADCSTPSDQAGHCFCCSIIFCEAVAIYGVIVAIILQTKLEGVTRAEGLYSKNNMAAGYAIFGAGITCGFSNLVCG
jgi:F0F1-type ATP synthase membrane subunit c/vacuolar-type H+-ATPase subunit K